MKLLDALRGGLIVSVQAAPGSPLDDPAIIAAMALAAEMGGAVALRIQGSANVRAVKSRCSLPVVGLIKRSYPGFEPYITPTRRDVEDTIEAGAEIVAFDATARARPDGASLEAIVACIHRAARIAMADCASLDDGRRACAAGADILGTTLCGYTEATRAVTLPAIELAGAFGRLGCFAICEGGIGDPASGRAALIGGADAIVVGTAISDLRARVGEFARALQNAPIAGTLDL
ncbi:MAG TPA: N-acetylmannosamine-6-phosphate 2-epimerase [Candidatus Dormibacteraeota bacterium]|nr:N-acetylmannosamine-6-phosphate 2-epimerase [Candidatus Dormibacteraeota bacterium]